MTREGEREKYYDSPVLQNLASQVNLFLFIFVILLFVSRAGLDRDLLLN